MFYELTPGQSAYNLHLALKDVCANNYSPETPPNVLASLKRHAGWVQWFLSNQETSYVYLDEIYRINMPSVQNGRIADLCCGPGKSTLAISDCFPNASVYGFDMSDKNIKKARRNAADRRNVTFEVADVYSLPPNRFDALLFNMACGKLSDAAIGYGIENQTPVIAGRFCCSHAIPDEMPRSHDFITNLYLAVYSRFLNPGFSKAPKDLTILSKFASEELLMTDDEMKRIGGLAIDSQNAARVVFYNRFTRLDEAGYDVSFNPEWESFYAIKSQK